MCLLFFKESCSFFLNDASFEFLARAWFLFDRSLRSYSGIYYATPLSLLTRIDKLNVGVNFALYCPTTIVVVFVLYSIVDNSNNVGLVKDYLKSHKMKNENEWKINMY